MPRFLNFIGRSSREKEPTHLSDNRDVSKVIQFVPENLGKLEARSLRDHHLGDLAGALEAQAHILEEQFHMSFDLAFQAEQIHAVADMLADTPEVAAILVLRYHSIVSQKSGLHYDPLEATNDELRAVWNNINKGEQRDVTASFKLIGRVFAKMYSLTEDEICPAISERMAAFIEIRTLEETQSQGDDKDWLSIEYHLTRYYTLLWQAVLKSMQSQAFMQV